MTMQGWITISIAAIAALIAYFQWITAHQRIVLDLFERRMEAFNAIEFAIAQTLTDSEPSHEAIQNFLQAEAVARFLFGDDVCKELEAFRDNIVLLRTYSQAAIDNPNLTDQERIVMARQRLDLLSKVGDYPRRLTRIVGRVHAALPKAAECMVAVHLSARGKVGACWRADGVEPAKRNGGD